MQIDYRKTPRTQQERDNLKAMRIWATIPRSLPLRERVGYYTLALQVVQGSTRRELARTVWPWQKDELKARSERPTVRGRRGLVAASAGA